MADFIRSLKNVNAKLIISDLLIFSATCFLILTPYRNQIAKHEFDYVMHVVLFVVVISLARTVFLVYNQIIRYGGIRCYVRLFASDLISFFIYGALNYILPWFNIGFSAMFAIFAVNLLFSLLIRIIYRYAYKYGNDVTPFGKLLSALLTIVTFGKVEPENNILTSRIKIAIVGAGRVGVTLAQELMENSASPYLPRCFIDIDKDKVGREIHGISVIPEFEATHEKLLDYDVQEIVFAVPNLSPDDKNKLYTYYSDAGYKVKSYDFPTFNSENSKRVLREFQVEDLLLRSQKIVTDEETSNYYNGKTVLLTGGGGSIGSEICRQVDTMHPKKIIILDIYENSAYNLWQELTFNNRKNCDYCVEIVSITDMGGLEKVFNSHKPDIVIHAAAHKHVPLMEHNCTEAVLNNIFGTLNVLKCCKKYGTKHFHMVSTDKSVNPVNVMGATKCFCEMMVMSFANSSGVKCSLTRFGNVLGSAGSVVPIFKRQIEMGGPVTITDKRIVRYLMTIPEASSLVLASAAMSNNGEIYVLDMGEPIRIIDLARNMIKLSGADNVEIKEIGLRPGEKLYEELLIDKDNMIKTKNELIFIEKVHALSETEIFEKIDILKNACMSNDDEQVKDALRKVIPTYNV